MATSTAEVLLGKLDKSSSATKKASSVADQLIMPADLLNRDDHSGLVVLFELNAIDYSKDSSNAVQTNGEKTKNLTSKKADGTDDTEVEMQKKGNATATASVRSSVPGYRKTGQSIVLPVPDNWIENMNIAWTQTNFGSIARSAELVQSITQGDTGAAGQQLTAMAPSVLAKVAGSGKGNIGKLADGAKRYVELMTGITANDFTEVLFSNMNNRMFPFQFTITPRNEKEAEIMRFIIARFKEAAKPELYIDGGDNGSYFRAPYTFDISFIHYKTGQKSKYWTRLQTVGLSNISVNRTPNNGVAVIRDSTDDLVPQSVVIELQFTELLRLVRSSGDLDSEDVY